MIRLSFFALLGALLLAGASAASDPAGAATTQQPLYPDAATDYPRADAGAQIANGGGTWIAVWQRSAGAVGGPLGSDWDVMFVRSTNGGKQWSAPSPVNNNAASDTYNDTKPQIATDGSGNWIVVWESGLAIPDKTMYSRSTDNGHSWSAPSQLSSSLPGGYTGGALPEIVSDGNGLWLATWSSRDVEDDIMISRSTNAGASWSTATVLNGNSGSSTVWDQGASLAPDGNGNWVAAWEMADTSQGSDSQVLVARSSNNGLSWSAPVTMTSLNHLDGGPTVATNRAGAWVLTWASREPFGAPDQDYEIVFSRSFDNGATWTARAPLNSNWMTDYPGDDSDPEIVTDGKGTWRVVWTASEAYNPGGWDVLIATSTNNGTTWTSSPQALNSSPGTNYHQWSPRTATDGSGTWLSVWTDFSWNPPDDQDIWYTGVTCVPPDSDCDTIQDVTETACGSDPNNAFKIPERRDGSFAGRDDDGDNLVDEALPANSSGHDCDGDGYTGAEEDNIFGAAARANQDPCGTGAWPADIVSGGDPSSTNLVTITDVLSFVAPVRRIDTSPGETGFSSRWDLSTGSGAYQKVINIGDVLSMTSVVPTMLGTRAFAGPSCPWPP